jgi:hypothetical protein
VWDFRGIFPRTTASARIDFTKITSPMLRLAVKEFPFSRLHNVATCGAAPERTGRSRRPGCTASTPTPACGWPR